MENNISITVSFDKSQTIPVEVRFPGCVNTYRTVEDALTDIGLAVRKAWEGEYPFGEPGA